MTGSWHQELALPPRGGGGFSVLLKYSFDHFRHVEECASSSCLLVFCNVQLTLTVNFNFKSGLGLPLTGIQVTNIFVIDIFLNAYPYD